MFAEVLSATEFDQLPEKRPWDYVIKCAPGSKPIDCKIYPPNAQEQNVLDEILEEKSLYWTNQDIQIPYGSSIFLCQKKDRDLRPVQNYRKLNDMTVKKKYPLPINNPRINKQIKTV